MFLILVLSIIVWRTIIKKYKLSKSNNMDKTKLLVDAIKCLDKKILILEEMTLKNRIRIEELEQANVIDEKDYDIISNIKFEDIN